MKTETVILIGVVGLVGLAAVYFIAQGAFNNAANAAPARSSGITAGSILGAVNGLSGIASSLENDFGGGSGSIGSSNNSGISDDEADQALDEFLG